MNTFRLEDFYLAMGLIIAIVIFMVLLPGCGDGGPMSTRVVDSEGNIVYEPPNQATHQVQIPSTGNKAVDYIFAFVAAAAYGGMGYAVRRTRVKGKAENGEISKRLDRLEAVNPDALRHPSLVHLDKELVGSTRLTDEQLRQIISRLAGDSTAEDHKTP